MEGGEGRGDLATTFYRMVTFLPTLMSREGEHTALHWEGNIETRSVERKVDTYVSILNTTVST